MGVNSLWDILRVVGRRVSINDLGGKTLAIDVSIWLIKFVKAMRNPDGSVIHGAHLIGAFRKILKLLYARIRPVFVFDGGTPLLKKHTLMTRTAKRKRAEHGVKETASAILMNHLIISEGRRAAAHPPGVHGPRRPSQESRGLVYTPEVQSLRGGEGFPLHDELVDQIL